MPPPYCIHNTYYKTIYNTNTALRSATDYILDTLKTYYITNHHTAQKQSGLLQIIQHTDKIKNLHSTTANTLHT